MTTTDVVRAVEDNQVEFLLSLGRAGGGKEESTPEIAWVIGGSPIGYHNAVVRADLSAEDADGAIAASLDLMRSEGVAGSWHVGPTMRPADLAERLERHGFEGVPEPGMAADLDALAEPQPVSGLEVERVTTTDDLDAYEHVLGLGFGEGPTEARWVCEMYARIGFDTDSAWRHFVARLDGRPVATASILFAAGVVGLYFVSTAPTDRRRGIGAAISRAALASGREEGFRTGVLGSSSMGRRVYEQLGFRDVCTLRVYEWDPARGDGG